jgi:hypothetical protein
VRSPLRLTLPTLAFATSLAWASRGWAEPPDSRFGLLPVVGVGMAGLTAPSPLPGFIGYSTLGAELFGQLRTWGLFLRFDFLSSGSVERTSGTTPKNDSSGWNAYSFEAGASYRLFGDSHTVSLFARAGLVYEHWVAEIDTPCQILIFVPNGCVTEGAMPVGFQGDAIGVTAGARLELPLKSFYVAFGASFVPLVTVNTSIDSGAAATALQPGDIFQLRFDIALGLRDAREDHAATHDSTDHRSKY